MGGRRCAISGDVEPGLLPGTGAQAAVPSASTWVSPPGAPAVPGDPGSTVRPPWGAASTPGTTFWPLMGPEPRRSHRCAGSVLPAPGLEQALSSVGRRALLPSGSGAHRAPSRALPSNSSHQGKRWRWPEPRTAGVCMLFSARQAGAPVRTGLFMPGHPRSCACALCQAVCPTRAP